MTPITRPRGPLPARVYWTRRLLLLVVVLGLVFGVARLLGGGGGSGPSARPVAADPTSTPTLPTPTPTPMSTPTPGLTPGPTGTPTAGSTPSGAGVGASPSALAAPSGACRNSDVVVVPSVASPAYALRPVILTLRLTTKVSPACTWVVSPANLAVRVSSGDDRFWSSQECRGAVPKQAVVVRRDAPATVSMAWNGLRSDTSCSRSTAWAEPGDYHVEAAALGADPTDVEFRLFTPPRPTITVTPTPSPSGAPSGRAAGTPRAR